MVVEVVVVVGTRDAVEEVFADEVEVEVKVEVGVEDVELVVVSVKFSAKTTTRAEERRKILTRNISETLGVSGTKAK